VTRHEVSRVVLCGVKIGDVAIEDAIMEMFDKPDPRQVAAEKAAQEAAAAGETKANVIDPADLPYWRRYPMQIAIYGVGGLLMFMVLVAFGDKFKKIWFHLMSAWIWS